MNIRLVVSSVLVLPLMLAVGCGGEDSDGAKDDEGRGSTTEKAGSSKSSADSDAAGSGAQAGGSSPGAPAPVKCGKTTCESKGGVIAAFFAKACCVDEASGTCGLTPTTGGDCAKPAESDPRCPDVDAMGFIQLPSCCMDNRCGIDATMFGMPGCVDLKNASTQVPAMGFIMFPQARTCDGVLDPVDTSKHDAGV